MENKTKKGDFVEIEFLGRNLTGNEIFDTNIAEELKKINPEAKTSPLIACIGHNMVVKGFDESLENKEIGKKYTIKLEPEKAFGKRDSKLIRLIPMKVFMQQKIYPQPGMTFALDSSLVKIVSVSGGRVLVDFNNPLAGKDVEYEFTITKKIEDMREKTNVIQRFLFGQEFELDIDESKKKIIFKDAKLMHILNAFASKFKEMLGYDIEIFQEKKKEDKEPEKEAKTDNK